MTFWQRLRGSIKCFKRRYHDFRFDGESVTGEWIRCYDCKKLDEYIPGIHEPKHYKPEARRGC